MICAHRAIKGERWLCKDERWPSAYDFPDMKSSSNPCASKPEKPATISRAASADQRIWLTVCAVPAGRIATYGDIAQRAGMPGAARRVGAALRRLPRGTEIPWHRIVNASGRSSLPPGRHGEDRQRQKLADEGVLLGRGGAAVLKRYRW